MNCRNKPNLNEGLTPWLLPWHAELPPSLGNLSNSGPVQEALYRSDTGCSPWIRQAVAQPSANKGPV